LAFLIRNYRRLAGFHHGDTRVRGAQIDANNLSHLLEFSLALLLKVLIDCAPPSGAA
jgi:hypothetical protein